MQLSLDDASPALSNVVFCVLDLETAGSSAEVGGITEIGAVKYQGGEEIARVNTLVKCSIECSCNWSQCRVRRK